VKIICEIKTGKLGTRTFTTVEGKPLNPAEQAIYKFVHAGINSGLDLASDMLNTEQSAKGIPGAARKLALQIVESIEPPKPEATK
jgi:hypothetical protein